MNSRFSKPYGLDKASQSLGRHVEEKLAEGRWLWWDVNVIHEEVMAEEPQIGGGTLTPAGEWGNPVSIEPQPIMVGLEAGVPPRNAVPGLLGNVTTPLSIVKWQVSSPRRTDGSTPERFLQARIADIPGEQWLTRGEDSMGLEFGTEPRVIEDVPDILLNEGAVIGGFVMAVGGGPTVFFPPTLRFGVQVVWR